VEKGKEGVCGETTTRVDYDAQMSLETGGKGAGGEKPVKKRGSPA